MLVKVKHRHGTSSWNPAGYSDWLEYWRHYSRQYVPAYCPECKMRMNDPVGAHVIKVDSNDLRVFITPVCRSCNSADSDTPFWVDDSLLVPVNR